MRLLAEEKGIEWLELLGGRHDGYSLRLLDIFEE
jgi:hypothetical protein